MNSEGKPGYFIQYLKIYGRGSLPCVKIVKTIYFILMFDLKALNGIKYIV